MSMQDAAKLVIVIAEGWLRLEDESARRDQPPAEVVLLRSGDRTYLARIQTGFGREDIAVIRVCDFERPDTPRAIAPEVKAAIKELRPRIRIIQVTFDVAPVRPLFVARLAGDQLVPMSVDELGRLEEDRPELKVVLGQEIRPGNLIGHQVRAGKRS
jgi:hypothetical protein